VSKLATLEQMRQLAQRSQDFTAEVAELAAAAAAAEFITISIPVSAWVENTDTVLAAEGFAYMADVAVEQLTAADGAETNIALSSRAEAISCGLAHLSQTQSGAIRYYAKSAPTTALVLQAQIMRAEY